MSASPLALGAKKVIDAAWLQGDAYDLSSQAAFALESAQLLQSPETAAELERLRARVAELERLLADYTEPDVDGAGRTYESYQPPVSLSTDCVNCGHTLNWHGKSGCSAGSAPARCGCRDFAPKQDGAR